ncbi:transcriptional regulator domain-containing protein [Sphingobium aquiterrae]|uniref:transcriptional regulator domain-containing protein n=1 Tax=Sphingobium aquiterrae TaxID=2038656 RepID=UPI003019D9ED
MPDPAVYDTIARRGPSALAWEVLRRDPAYRAAFAARQLDIVPGRAADRAFVARWGLHFR